MNQYYIDIHKLLRSLRLKVLDAAAALRENNPDGARTITEYAKRDLNALQAKWGEHLPPQVLTSNLPRHLHFGTAHDYEDILRRDLPAIEDALEKWANSQQVEPRAHNFRALLHPRIEQHSLHHYESGHLREAVLNAVMAVFDFLRERTGLTLDGMALITEALSLERAKLILSELRTESGKNDQKGFILFL